jgi:ribosomal protein L19
MRKSFTYVIGLITLFAATLLAQNPQSFSGTVSDSMCGAQHMMKNLTPAQCTRECVKQGSDYALVVGSKVYTLKGDKAQIDKFAGQRVTIKGDASGSTITVKSIAAAKA